jgi:hypothetical protein
MATHAILVPNQIAATNIDSLNRSAVSAVDLDNGNIVLLSTYGVAAGQKEVWTAIAPSVGAGLTDVWMVYDPELVWTSNYRGLDPDVRNFYVKATRIMSIYQPRAHDIFTITGDGLATGTGAESAFVNCTDASGVKMEWAASAGSSIFAAQYLKKTYFSLGTGGIDTQRIVAYQFEVVHV